VLKKFSKQLGICKAQAHATVTSIVSRARTARCRTAALGLRLFLAVVIHAPQLTDEPAAVALLLSTRCGPASPSFAL